MVTVFIFILIKFVRERVLKFKPLVSLEGYLYNRFVWLISGKRYYDLQNMILQNV